MSTQFSYSKTVSRYTFNLIMFVTCSSLPATAKLSMTFKKPFLYWVQNSSNGNFNSPLFRAQGDNDVDWAITVEPHGSSEDVNETRFSVILRLAKNNQSENGTSNRRKFLLAKFQLSVIDKTTKRVITSVVAENYRGFLVSSEEGKRIWFPTTEAEILALPAFTISQYIFGWHTSFKNNASFSLRMQGYVRPSMRHGVVINQFILKLCQNIYFN